MRAARSTSWASSARSPRGVRAMGRRTPSECLDSSARGFRLSMNVVSRITRLIDGSPHAVGRVMLAMTCVLAYCATSEADALATEIAILKSSSISAYDQAITGFKSTAPAGVIYSEYDVQGDLEQGRRLARRIR